MQKQLEVRSPERDRRKVLAQAHFSPNTFVGLGSPTSGVKSSLCTIDRYLVVQLRLVGYRMPFLVVRSDI